MQRSKIAAVTHKELRKKTHLSYNAEFPKYVIKEYDLFSKDQ